MARTTHRYTDEERTFALDYGQKKLAELRAEGVARVRVMSSGDANVCRACKRLDGKVFLIEDAPALPIHEESAETWYICRCVYMSAECGARLTPRKLPRIPVTGLESFGLSGELLTKTKRRIVNRLRDVKCAEHGAVPMSVHLERVDVRSAKVTVASCCGALHGPTTAAVGVVLQSIRGSIERDTVP